MLVGYQRYRSSWTQGGRTCQGHQCRSGRQGFATVELALIQASRIAERTYAQNAVLADQLDQGVGVRAGGIALAISLEVTKVTNVSLRV